jgi:TonB-linked SusC/RagA family outer membrane protein
VHPFQLLEDRVKSRPVLLAALLLLATAVPAVSQTGGLMINVRDRESGQPLSGAQVALTGARPGGQLTNDQGRVLFPALPAGTYTTTVTFLGYSEIRRTDVAVRSGETTTLDLHLERTVLSLQEVVVSGSIDPTSGIKLPFTVSKVGTEQLQVPSVGSALGSIQGKVAGVNIQRTSGQPGGGVNIQLRSPTSFEGSNSPLIVVDGVIIARDLDRTTADIESLDIVDIEIIKGAAAASLYGSRAASGVISITTDRGRNSPQNATRISSRTEFGKDFLAGTVPISGAHHYIMDTAGTTLTDTAGTPVGWGGRTARTVAAYGGTARMMDQPYPGQVYDNLRAVYNPGQYMNQNFSVSQNTATTTFLLGLTRLDQAGALANNKGFQRNTGRVSLDHRIGQKLNISMTGAHTRSWRDNISGNPYTAVLTYPAYVDLSRRDANGQYVMQPDSSVEIENPIGFQVSKDNQKKPAHTQGSLNTRYTLFSWMSLDAQLSYDRADIKTQVYVPKGTPVIGDDPANGQLSYTHRENDAYNGALGGTLMRRFGDLNTRLAVRGTFEREFQQNFYAEGRDFFVSGIRDLLAARTLYDMDSGMTDVRANGMLADLSLDYKDRYVGSFLIRRDGSSLFGPLERHHIYKRASAKYLISREEWFQVPWINELGIRYAMGEAGGRPGFSWQYETWLMDRTTGLSKSTAGNPALKPEFTREHDVGIDFIGFGNRMQLELVYARQMTRDNIIVLPATVMSGYNSFRANAAKMSGRTYEMTLTAYPIRRRDLTWSLTAIADNSVNTLEEWGRACFWGSNAGRSHEFTCAGERAGNFWVQRTARSHNDLPSWLQNRKDEFVVNNDGFLVWVGKKSDGTPNSWMDGVKIANQATFCDGSRQLGAVSGGCGWGSLFSTNGFTYRWGEPFRAWDETSNQVQRDLGGNSLPDVNFGFNTNVRYRGFSTYLGFRGQLGGKVYNDAKQWFYNQLRHGDLDQSGKPDELKKPLDYYQRGLANSYSGWIDYFLEDGTHLKLGEARLSYRFSQAQTRRLLGSMAPQTLTVGGNARNLFTLTKYSGFDPERGTPLSRVEGIGYPHLRNLTMTVDIVF